MPTIHFVIKDDQRGQAWLRVERQPDQYTIGPVRFTLGVQQIADVRAQKQAIADGIGDWIKLRDHAEMVGSILFSALIHTDLDIRAFYRTTLAQVRNALQQGHKGVLHLLLTFERDEFCYLPWELLFDPEEKLFLSTSNHIAISRSSEHLQESGLQTLRPPLRLLVVMATPALAVWPGLREPPCLDTLSLARIFERLQQYNGKKLVQYTLLSGQEATSATLQRALQSNYDVLYFVGHSYTRDGNTFLLLEDGTRMRRGVRQSVSELSQYLQASGVRVVILSSCDSFAGATALSGLEQLTAVVGMSMEMPMITAAAFDEAVIDAMVAWQPLEQCILYGRRQVKEVLRERTQDDKDWEFIDRPDWAIPVLFTRAPMQDPRFCTIPAGTYQLGLDEAAMTSLGKQLGYTDRPPDFVCKWIGQPRTVFLPAFQIGRWPVTNHQYRYYLQDTQIDILGKRPLPPGFVRHDGVVSLIGLTASAPVVGVTWKDANDFCHWVGGRLPTADEWEVAARGPAGSIFPWGDAFNRQLCSAVDNCTGGPESVLHHQAGASLFEVEDLCGNVFEWTVTETSRGRRLIAGGSWNTSPIHTLPSLRCPRDPSKRYRNVGFRCAM